ncbi:transcriptional regulator [Stetteria hydrogenophila]
MNRDQAVGAGLAAGSLLFFVIYAYILLFTRYDLVLLKLTALALVGIAAGILAWIGYTLATTPPPKPIEEIEKEVEEELKKLEQEQEKAGQEAGGKEAGAG